MSSGPIRFPLCNQNLAKSENMEIKKQITIGITTKDRWDDLRETFGKLRDFGFSSLPLVLIDDGSASPCPFDPQDFFPDVRFIVHEKAGGLVRARNEIIHSTRTPFCLNLDDDSFPVDGDISLAVEHFLTNPEVGAISFNAIGRDESLGLPEILPNYSQVRFFLGCAHMINCSLFREVGGYSDDLFFYHEEVDLTIRFHRAGYRSVFSRDLTIRHNKSPVNRIAKSRANQYAKSFGLIFARHTEWKFLLEKCLKSPISLYRTDPVKGYYLSSLFHFYKSVLDELRRDNVSHLISPSDGNTYSRFKQWDALPHPPCR